MLKGREIGARHRWVRGPNGKYRPHSVVGGIRGRFFDLTEARKAAAAVGFKRRPMQRIRRNGTFVKGGDPKMTLAETGGVSSVREARADWREWLGHGAMDPL